MASICLRYFLHVGDSSPVYPRILFFRRISIHLFEGEVDDCAPFEA